MGDLRDVLYGIFADNLSSARAVLLAASEHGLKGRFVLDGSVAPTNFIYVNQLFPSGRADKGMVKYIMSKDTYFENAEGGWSTTNVPELRHGEVGCWCCPSTRSIQAIGLRETNTAELSMACSIKGSGSHRGSNSGLDRAMRMGPPGCDG